MSNMRYLLLTLFILFGVSFVNGAHFETDQDITLNAYQNADLSILESVVIFGSDNYSYSYSGVGGNNTKYYDIRREYDYVDNDIYVVYPNEVSSNNTIQIHLGTFSTDGTVVTITTFNITMEELGTYYFRVRPDRTGERIRLELNTDDNVTILSIVSTKNAVLEKTDSITSTFIGAMSDFISIQIGFWKILYYLFIFMVILSGIGLLIGFAFKIYSWAEKLSEKKRDVVMGGSSLSKSKGK